MTPVGIIDESESPASVESAVSEERIKVLVADEDALSRRSLRSALLGQGHEVLIAADGEDAVDLFVDERPDVVLLGVRLPGIDGLEAARRIRSHDVGFPVPIVFLIAVESSEIMAHCVAAGGDDFLSKPVNGVALVAKVGALKRMRGLHRVMVQQYAALSRHASETDCEMEGAERILRKMRSKGCLDVSNIRYRLSPKSLFNGDLLLAERTPGDALRVLVGDFTGHGLPAAVGALPLSEIFFGMTKKGCSLGDTAIEMNLRLKQLLPTGIFCAAAMVEIDAARQSLEIWNAGLPAPVAVLRSGEVRSRYPSDHLALGITTSSRDYGRTARESLAPGLRIYLFTDGVVEKLDRKGEMFGEGRIPEVLASGADRSDGFGDLLVALKMHAGAQPQEDDLTLVEIDCDRPLPVVNRAIDSDIGTARRCAATFSMRHEFGPQALRQADPMPILMHSIKELGVPEDYWADLFTIFAELCCNSIEHGLLGLESRLKAEVDGFARFYALKEERLASLERGRVSVSVEQAASESGGRVVIEVSDSGNGFDVERFRAQRRGEGIRNQPHGRGIELVESLCAQVDIAPGGNAVTAVYEWQWPEA